jgi:phenylglyoxylate dehydrogenase delta subunit
MLPGDWRSMRPVVDRDKCVKCAVCWLYCPVQCVEEHAGLVRLQPEDLQGLRHLRQRMPAAGDHHDSGGA